MRKAGDEGLDDAAQHWSLRLSRLLSRMAIAALIVVILVEHILPEPRTALPLLIVIPTMTLIGLRGTWRPLAVGLITLITTLVVGLPQFHMRPGTVLTCVIGVVLSTLISWAAAISFDRQRRTLTDLRTVADAAQRALLRPLPGAIGDLRIEVRYLAAAAEAHVGGDLYDVVHTPHGVRLIVGDVMGKGLPAVEAAADVLGSFREAAHDQERLYDLAQRIDATLRRRAESTGFATAVVGTILLGDGQANLMVCGHPPPLVLRDGKVYTVSVPEPHPPLGLLDLAIGSRQPTSIGFEPGDCLLLYTDGITEARNRDGQFYPLEDRVTALAVEDPDELLGAIYRDLLKHVGGRLLDDAALLLIQRSRD
ncbi:PP2C family protein-serine/threonine phosphatase [Rhizohabitans arisaemae]|uniref:PP2C family protein-serine/threonine phosphatase n=1 Tax=Rhizohabitans arisaemae TaxID=2720610 RepID=UPI0024B059CD|nr:PP2C family protein-serine/threonine phosphatase [Rhizohabitans arisaemae]